MEHKSSRVGRLLGCCGTEAGVGAAAAATALSKALWRIASAGEGAVTRGLANEANKPGLLLTAAAAARAVIAALLLPNTPGAGAGIGARKLAARLGI